MKNISFKLNDFQYTINNKLTLIQACLKNRVDVPRFCFHEKLSIAGNCRMCLVEDLKQVKPLASCAINVSDSMNIYTNTLKVKKARESVLEFLLANHPLDCPICDQGGECDLQDQSLVFGSDRGRFYEFKRSVEDKDCGPLIKTVMNRCIHCTRCVRFSNEVAGVNVLGITGRGAKMEIGFYIENLMSSELSGNIIDLCPVGALTSKPFAFTSRPWELKSFNSIDILDSMHSNIRIDVRGTKIMRILPRVNIEINEDWITDKIRFSYDSFRRQRLYDPMLRLGGEFIKISWKKAFFYAKANFLNAIRAGWSSFVPLRGFVGDYVDLETLYVFKKFLSLNGSVLPLSTIRNFDFPSSYAFNLPLTSLHKSDLCLLVGVNLRIDLPLLNSRIKALVAKNLLPVFILGFYSNFNYFVKHISSSQTTFLAIFEGSHWLSSKLSKGSSKYPLVIASSASFFSVSSVMPVLLRYTNLFSKNWIGLNFIPEFSSFVPASELGLVSKHGQNSNLLNFSFDILLNFDGSLPVKDLSASFFRVYQGHHGDVNSQNCELILPSTSFIEKNSFFSNLSRVVQKSKKVLFNPGNSRDDWKILNSLVEVFGFSSFKVANSFELLSFISSTSPFVLYRGNGISVFSSFFANNLLLSSTYCHLKNFTSTNNNYYLNDSITRNSKVMSLCATKFKSKNYNFFIV